MLEEDGLPALLENKKTIKRAIKTHYYKGHIIYLELKEAGLQSLLVHHPVIVLLCLQDACIHLTEQDTQPIKSVNRVSLPFIYQHSKIHGQKLRFLHPTGLTNLQLTSLI